MRKQVKKGMAGLLGFILTVSFLALPVRADQPYMRAAKTALENALKHLEKADTDKGGHRMNAKALASRALVAVNAGIAYDQQNPATVASEGGTLASDPSNRDQASMLKARQSLQTAIGALTRASADKGGHRNQALELAREAIAEVNKGIEYDRKH